MDGRMIKGVKQMTDEHKAKLAQARADSAARKQTATAGEVIGNRMKDATKDMLAVLDHGPTPGTDNLLYREVEYNGHVIVIEGLNTGGGRVIATKNGLHCAEWHTQTVNEGVGQAKAYIDAR